MRDDGCRSLAFGDVLTHYHPRAIPYWNETHTYQAISRFIDPHAPYRIFSLGNDSPFFAETIGLPYFSARCREILKPCFGNWRGGMVSS